MSPDRWKSGDVVALREIWKGRVWKARPYIVVHDRPDSLAFFLPQGTPTKIPDGGSGIPQDEWTLQDGVFEHTALRLVDPGKAHSVLLFWDDGGFKCWYVNLEEPMRRSAVGFDYLDHELDIVVDPDRSWHLVDEDEFEEAQQLGVISASDADAIRSEAERVIARIERWEPPFCDGWEQWQPDPDWKRPELPQGWETVQGGQ